MVLKYSTRTLFLFRVVFANPNSKSDGSLRD